MSEQPSSATSFEAYRYPADTAFFRNGDQINLQGVGSDLPSPDEGRELARQRVQEALSQQERRPEGTPELDLLTYGTHTVDMRLWEQELAESVGPVERIFREVRTNFGRQAMQADRTQGNFDAWERELMGGTSDDARNFRAANDDFQRQQPAQTDMMGYEPINTGR